MVMTFVGGVLLVVDSTFFSIPTVGNLRGGSLYIPACILTGVKL